MTRTRSDESPNAMAMSSRLHDTPLARVVDGHALAGAVVTPDRQGRVRLHGVMVLGRRCVRVVERDRSGRQRCLDVAVGAIRWIESERLLRYVFGREEIAAVGAQHDVVRRFL